MSLKCKRTSSMSLFLIRLASVSALKCDLNNSFFFQKNCVYYYDELVTWFQAESRCYSVGLELATITTSVKASSISDSITQSDRTKLGFWTGGMKVPFSETYSWPDNVLTTLNDTGLFDEQHREPTTSRRMDCLYLSVDDALLRRADCHLGKAYLCEAVAPRVWFGENLTNNFLCQCSHRKCDSFGYCLEADRKCRSGWFGDRCQYTEEAMPRLSNIKILQDEDDLTCSFNLPSPLKLTMAYPIPFSFMRIVLFLEDGEHKEITFQLRLMLGSDLQHCGQNVVNISKGVFDIVCLSIPIYFDSLTFVWPQDIPLCSIYLSKGRSLAVTRDVGVDGVLMPTKYTLVDSVESIASYCTKPISGAEHQSILIDLVGTVMITQINLFRKRGLRDFSHMTGLKIETLNFEGDIIFKAVLNSTFESTRVVLLLTESSAPVCAIRLTLDLAHTHNNDSFIELCEVLAYGDCAPPYYGLECIKECPTSCKHRRCHYDGQCIVPCPANQTGYQCAKKLGDWKTSLVGQSMPVSALHVLSPVGIGILILGIIFLFSCFLSVALALLTLEARRVDQTLHEVIALNPDFTSPMGVTKYVVPKGVIKHAQRNQGINETHRTLSVAVDESRLDLELSVVDEVPQDKQDVEVEETVTKNENEVEESIFLQGKHDVNVKGGFPQREHTVDVPKSIPVDDSKRNAPIEVKLPTTIKPVSIESLSFGTVD